MKFLPQILPILAFTTAAAVAQDSDFSKPVITATPAVVSPSLDEKGLGEMLNSIGLRPLKTDKRYDFAFKTTVRGEEWKFSMSAVLSRNSETVWVMAWLDEIPKTSAEVPRTALLRLLAANDRMGNGKFFAYIPTNRRFVLQRVVKNKDITKKTMMAALQDLALSVADEYPNWAVTNWSPKAAGADVVASENGKGGAKSPGPANGSREAKVQTSEAASKFGERVIQ